jgi:hypothetical protein
MGTSYKELRILSPNFSKVTELHKAFSEPYDNLFWGFNNVGANNKTKRKISKIVAYISLLYWCTHFAETNIFVFLFRNAVQQGCH